MIKLAVLVLGFPTAMPAWGPFSAGTNTGAHVRRSKARKAHGAKKPSKARPKKAKGGTNRAAKGNSGRPQLAASKARAKARKQALSRAARLLTASNTKRRSRREWTPCGHARLPLNACLQKWCCRFIDPTIVPPTYVTRTATTVGACATGGGGDSCDYCVARPPRKPC